MPHPVFTTTVLRTRDVAPGVRELTLAGIEPPLEFAPGQWLSLQLPVGERPPLVRAYSLAAAPAPSGELVLCLDRVPDGLGSDYLFSLQAGDEVHFSGPLGNFKLPDQPGDLLWLARYTGIVPFRAMLQALERHGTTGRVLLVYEAPRPEDLAYHAELVRAAEELPWFELRATVEEPGEGWSGAVGTAADLMPETAEMPGAWTPMICGTRDFVRPLRDRFYEAGYDRKAVKWENYD